MTNLRTIEGWTGATISAISASGAVRIEFEQSGHLIIYSPLIVKMGSNATVVDPLVTSGEVPDLLRSLEGMTVLSADINEAGALRLHLDRAQLVVEPDEAAEAFELTQPGSPHTVVSGMGGEIFEWDR